MYAHMSEKNISKGTNKIGSVLLCMHSTVKNSLETDESIFLRATIHGLVQ